MYVYGDMKDAKPGDILEPREEDQRRYGKANLVRLTKIEPTSSGNKYWFVNAKGEDDWIRTEQYWRLVLSAPPADLKRGDKVLRVSGSEFLNQVKHGELLTIRVEKDSGSSWIYTEIPNNAYHRKDFVKILQPKDIHLKPEPKIIPATKCSPTLAELIAQQMYSKEIK